MITFNKALNILKKNVQETKENELIFTETANLRVLNKNYSSKNEVPRENLSSMDGIVILKNEKIKKLKIVGESKAGDNKGKEFKNGECSLIYTGAPIFGDDKKVVPKENFVTNNQFVIIKKLPKNNFIRKKASDLKKNKIYLKKKTLLNIRSIVLAKSMRLKKLEVLKKPKIFVICTGDEIVSNSKRIRVVEPTNHIFIKYFVELFGGEIKKIKYSKDTNDDFVSTFNSFLDYDLLITSGGVSKGKYDIVKPSLQKFDLNILFDKILIKPGKPTTFGKFTNKKYFLGLPGNPVSCFMSLLNFFPIFINSFFGLNLHKFTLRKFCSKRFIEKNNQLTQFQRVVVKKNYFEISKDQDSSLINILNSSNGILIRKPFSPQIKPNDKVNILLFEDIFRLGT